MGKLYILMGKSSSGKDTFYQRLLDNENLNLKKVTSYTTRPIREGEMEGQQYHFVTAEKALLMEQEGKIIELRRYPSVYGVWKYFTADDGQIDLKKANYLMIGTLETFLQIKKYYGSEKVVPIYIEVEDGERLQRALNREKADATPRYAEMCRSFLADTKDFSEENIDAAGIKTRFQNVDFEETLRSIEEYVVSADSI